MDEADRHMALLLQKQFDMEMEMEQPRNHLVYNNTKKEKQRNNDTSKSLVDPSWELVDPTPDVHVLFIAFNRKFFWGKLAAVTVSWSKRMTTCAGICSYEGRAGMCKITLSEPLLKLRPRKDLVETLLHEMIHALLFVTNNNRDRDGHGPEFHKHMYRINGEAGTNITVYHDFHDEVNLYQQHWWRCDGACRTRRPFYGFVKRAMNRAPGPNDRWWADHQRTCDGKFIKIKEPEKVEKPKKATKAEAKAKELQKNTSDIRNFAKTGDNVKTFSDIKGAGSAFGVKNKNGTVVLPPRAKGETSNKENLPKTVSKIVTINDLKNETNNNFVKQKTKDKLFNNPNTQENVKSPKFDYSTVRNHWLSKFDVQDVKTTDSNQIKETVDSYHIKRKAVKDERDDAKKMKVDELIEINIIECPVCNLKCPKHKVNQHLDTCLAVTEVVPSSKTENKLISHVDSFQTHPENLQKCKKNDESHIKCPNCDNLIKKAIINEHLDDCLSQPTISRKTKHESSVCGICHNLILKHEFDFHVAKCLNKMYDDLESKYNLNKESASASEPSQSNTTECSSLNNTTSCLVCNEIIEKESLNTHLEICINHITPDSKSTDDDEIIDDIDKDGVRLYNCPICTKMFSEEKMNDHIDICVGEKLCENFV